MQRRSELFGAVLAAGSILVASAVAYVVGAAQGTAWAEGGGEVFSGIYQGSALLLAQLAGLLIALIAATIVAAFAPGRPLRWLGVLVVAVTVALILGFNSTTGRLGLPDIAVALVAATIGAALGYLMGRSVRTRRQTVDGPPEPGGR